MSAVAAGVALFRYQNEVGRACAAARRRSALIDTDVGPIEPAEAGDGVPLLSIHAARPSAPSGGTKLAEVVELLQRDRGATINELIDATGWLPHTTRAALTALRKRGFALAIDRTDGRSLIRSRR